MPNGLLFHSQPLDWGQLLAHPALLAAGFAIVTLAFFVRAAIGFGSGLVSVALLSLLFPIKQVVPVVLLLDIIAPFYLGIYDLHELRGDELKALLPASLAGLALGSVVLARTDAQSLTTFLGVFILAYVAYALLLRPERLPQISRRWAWPLGTLGGVIGSLYGGGGPPIVAYLQMRHLDKRAFRATFQAIALVDNLLRALMYLLLGLLNLALGTVFLALAPAALLGLYLGNHLHFRIPQRAFLYATLALLAGVGIKYLV